MLPYSSILHCLHLCMFSALSHSVGGTSWDSSEADDMFESKKKVNVRLKVPVAHPL